MTNNPRVVTDGAVSLLGGVDEGRAPLLIRPDQVSRAINTTMRGGFLKTRPPFFKRGLQFESGEVADWYFNHWMQGYGYYDDFRGMEKILQSIGGRIFLIDVLNGFMVTDITPRKTTATTAAFTAQDSLTDVLVSVSNADLIFEGYPIYINGKEYQLQSRSGTVLTVRTMEESSGTVVALGAVVEFLDPNSPNQPLAWFEQAEQHMVIQDDQSAAIFFDGSSTRRAKSGELVSGSAMIYAQGRVWIAVNSGREYVAGDIAGGPTGVLGMVENTFLAGGGAFRVPSNVGKIRAMQFVANMDTSLGQGPVQVLCDYAVFSCNAPSSRELWAVMKDPIQTVSLINFGAQSQYSTVLVNGDLFFRAEDGLRSFFIARRDFGTWGNTPISTEMVRTMGSDTPELLVHSAAVNFDNRILLTAVPTPGTNGVRHKCIVALDFELISTLQGKAPPAFDGFWTGMEVTGLLTGRFAGRNRCFAFVHGAEGTNELWEILEKGTHDNGSSPIQGRVEYRSMLFPKGGSASGLKRLEAGEIWVSEFADEVDFTLTYRPDQYPCWQEWGSKTICVTSNQCSEEDACGSTASLSNMRGFKTRLGFGMPADVNDEADEKAMRSGFSFQPCLEWSGYAIINRFIVYAHEEQEWGMAPPSDDRSECGVIQCCPPDPFEYAASCGALDAPIARFYTIFNGLGEYYLQFPVIAGRVYQTWRQTEEQVESGLLFTATETGIYTYPMLRIAPIGETEITWYAVVASGDCPALTSREASLTIVY